MIWFIFGALLGKPKLKQTLNVIGFCANEKSSDLNISGSSKVTDMKTLFLWRKCQIHPGRYEGKRNVFLYYFLSVSSKERRVLLDCIPSDVSECKIVSNVFTSSPNCTALSSVPTNHTAMPHPYAIQIETFWKQVRQLLHFMPFPKLVAGLEATEVSS